MLSWVRAGGKFPEVSEPMFGSPAKHGKVGAMPGWVRTFSSWLMLLWEVI